MTVYKATLSVIYDGDNKVVKSKPIFLEMVGPTIPAAMSIVPGDKTEWDRCVNRNVARFSKIGYKIYEDR